MGPRSDSGGRFVPEPRLLEPWERFGWAPFTLLFAMTTFAVARRGSRQHADSPPDTDSGRKIGRRKANRMVITALATIAFAILVAGVMVFQMALALGAPAVPRLGRRVSRKISNADADRGSDPCCAARRKRRERLVTGRPGATDPVRGRWLAGLVRRRDRAPRRSSPTASQRRGEG